LQEGFKKLCMMTSLRHGTLASASALASALESVALLTSQYIERA